VSQVNGDVRTDHVPGHEEDRPLSLLLRDTSAQRTGRPSLLISKFVDLHAAPRAAIADVCEHCQAALVPALRVVVVERAGGLRDDTKQESGGIAKDPPGVHHLCSFGAKFFQPGDFGGQVVGVDIQVRPARAVAEPLDEQPNSWPGPGVMSSPVVAPALLLIDRPIRNGNDLVRGRDDDRTLFDH
jgi:hypothetical protein